MSDLEKAMIIGAIGIGVWLLLGSPMSIQELKADVAKLKEQLTGKPADASTDTGAGAGAGAQDSTKAATQTPDAATTTPEAAPAAETPPAAAAPEPSTPASTDSTPTPAPPDTGATSGTPAPAVSHDTPVVATNPATGITSVIHPAPHAISNTQAVDAQGNIIQSPAGRIAHQQIVSANRRKQLAAISQTAAHREAIKHLDPTFRAKELALLKEQQKRAAAPVTTTHPAAAPHPHHAASILRPGQRFISSRSHGHTESYPAGWYTTPGAHHHCNPNEPRHDGLKCCCINHGKCAYGTCGGGGTISTSHHHTGGHGSRAHYSVPSYNTSAYDLYSYY